MRSWLLTWGLVTMLGLSALPAGAQVPAYEEFRPAPEYIQALALVDRGRLAEGVSQWLDIAARNPGTTLAAQSLLQAAFYCPNEGQRESIYRSVASGFPGSRFDLHARLALANLKYRYDDIPRWIQEVDALIRSVGGPGWESIRRAGDRGQLTRQYQSLPPETQQGLAVCYRELLNAMVFRLKRFDEALPLALFNHETLPGHDDGGSMLVFVLVGGWGAPRQPKVPAVPRIDPQVRMKSPKEGQKKGPRPRFRARVQVGDFRYPQVNLSQLQFLVDGVDLRGELVIRSKVDSKLQVGKVLEKLKLTWRPKSPLSQGPHSITLVVPTAGYTGTGPGISRVTLNFTVRNSRDDEEDECDDDGDDWD